MQALLLARLEANASGDKQLAQALVIPKNLEDEALRLACQAQHYTLLAVAVYNICCGCPDSFTWHCLVCTVHDLLFAL